jgi:hypothetical protein
MVELNMLTFVTLGLGGVGTAIYVWHHVEKRLMSDDE